LIGKLEGKRLFGRPRRRWKENIKIEYKGMEWVDVDRIYMVQDMDR
jgi:hypothetical protein